MAYRVKKAFAGLPELTTTVDGVRVALNGAYVRTKEGTPTTPPKTVNVPLATQEQMKKIFERGDPCVEQYEEKEQKPFFNHRSENPFGGATAELLEEHGIKEKDQKTKPKDKKNEP
jgi:hypothetical protein